MTLHLPLEIWQQLTYFTNISSPEEVTGIGTIKVLDRQNLQVEQIFLPRQYVSQVHCQFDEGALNDIIFDLIKDSSDRAESLRFRWHSHAQSEVFWSATDEADIETWSADWVVNLVMNIHDEILARLDIYQPFRLANLPLTVKIDYPLNQKLWVNCYREIKQNLRKSLSTAHDSERKV